MNRLPYPKYVIWYMVFVILMIGIAPRAEAGLAPSATLTLPKADRAQDMQKVQQILEKKMIRERLAQLGFRQGEIKSRLDQMSDQQLHQFAQRLDQIKVGGDGVGIVIAVLVIIVLVVLLLQLTGHRVRIT